MHFEPWGNPFLGGEQCSPRRCILILGMHRSGTSSLTGSLQMRGLALGKVFTKNKFNAQGNRENSKVMELNDEVLTASGGSWDHPPIQLSWNHAMEQRREQLIASLRRAATQAWGFKDPRTLLTLPFWQKNLVDSRMFVGIFRHPLSVAQSLKKRGGMQIQDSLILWEQYNSKLIEAWERQPFPLLTFDNTAEEYEQSLLRVGDELGLRRLKEGARFFNDTLRHHSNTIGSSDLPAETLKLYGRLCKIYSTWRDQPQACLPSSSV